MPRVADRVLAPQSNDDFLPRFRASIDPEWIEEALVATGTATIRRRRLPAEQVIWLVLGMGIMRDQPLTEIVAAMDLALPGKRGVRVAPSTIVQARERLGDDPIRWLFERTAPTWAHASARRLAWRGLALYGADGTTLRVPDSEENRAHFGSQKGRWDGISGYPLARMVTPDGVEVAPPRRCGVRAARDRRGQLRRRLVEAPARAVCDPARPGLLERENASGNRAHGWPTALVDASQDRIELEAAQAHRTR